MPNVSSLAPSWDTASLGHPADISPLELSVLGEHLNLCGHLGGPGQSLQAGAERIQGFLAGRVVTSVLVLTLLVGGVWLML